jgi:isopenicillin-N epimerase
MDESKYPTSGSEILTAAKGLDLDEATYKPPKYSFPIFDDALYKPSEFGKAMRDTNFAIGDFTFLNNGSYGACPKVVIEAQKRWEEYLERSPVSFYWLDLAVFEVHAIRELAKFIGAPPKNVLLVENATMGTNVVLRSLPFTKDDEVVYLNIGYTSVINTMHYLAKRIGFKLVQVNVPAPIVMSKLLTSFEEAITPNTKLAVFDHISSSPGIILPIKDMIAICKAKGVPTLIDGAHAIGQVPLNMKEIGSDFYVSNCHKWLYSAKGSAFLYASDEHISKLHPTVISNNYGSSTQIEFLYSGTGNYSPKLTIVPALEFYNKIGGAEKVIKYCHNLAWEAANELKRAWGTQFVVSETENENYEQYFGNMVAIALPVPKFSTAEKARGHAGWLRYKIWTDYKVEVPITVLDNQLYVRISAQIWNEKADFLTLIPIINEIYESLEK